MEANYPVDMESLLKHFPDGFEVPELLVAFGNGVKGKRWGSVGCFRVQGERFDDHWIENGTDLYRNFAFFLGDPTGGRVGYWLYDGPATVAPPIVFVGSEGELRVVGQGLEDFLWRIVKGETGVPDVDSRDGGDERAELGRWLELASVKTMVGERGKIPDLTIWFDEWGRRQREFIDGDSFHLEIGEKLRKFVKPEAKVWELANFDVLLVGTQFKMWHRWYGAKPLGAQDIDGLEAAFRAVRERRARAFPERGLWFSSWVKVGAMGGAVLCCNFLDEPEVLDERQVVARSDYESDMRAFPRSKYWIPDWLGRQS